MCSPHFSLESHQESIPLHLCRCHVPSQLKTLSSMGDMRKESWQTDGWRDVTIGCDLTLNVATNHRTKDQRLFALAVSRVLIITLNVVTHLRWAGRLNSEPLRLKCTTFRTCRTP